MITDRHQQLRSRIDRLHRRDRDFAQSLLDTPFPSERQREWLDILTQQTDDRPKIRIPKAKNIFHLLETAGQHLKHPTVTFWSALPIRMELAGDIIELYSGRRTFQGDLSRRGWFDPRSDDAEAIGVLLTAFAADPVGMARQYGRRSGRCVFCGLLLTDPRSLAVGYGPVCATKWGLPWQKVDDTNMPTEPFDIELPPPPTPRPDPLPEPPVVDTTTMRRVEFKRENLTDWGHGRTGTIQAEVPENWVIVPEYHNSERRLAAYLSEQDIRFEAGLRELPVRYTPPSGRSRRCAWRLFVLRLPSVSDAVMLRLAFGSEVA